MTLVKLYVPRLNVPDLVDAIRLLGYKIPAVNTRKGYVLAWIKGSDPIEAITNLRQELISQFTTDYAISL